MVQLRDYQSTAVDRVREALRTGKRKVLLVIATGGGKTTVASEMMRGAMLKGNRSLFIAHRRELVEQCADRLRQFGIHPGLIMAGKRQQNKPVMVASVPTLTQRMKHPDALPQADLVIVDEAHHSTAASFQRVIDFYAGRGASVLGLTATPFRTDGRGLGDIYEVLEAPISMRLLIDRGYLVPSKTYGPYIDLSSINTKGSDYDQEDLFEKFDKRPLYDEVVANYQKFAPGSRAIVFNIKVQHSLNTAAAFNAAGIHAQHVDGDTDPLTRSRILQDFKDGKFPVLCNVNILTEGYDLPAIETVILNRATQSKGLYMQMVGRGLRPVPGKAACIVIDQGANIYAHGPVDQDEEFSLAAKKKKKGAGAAPVRECPECALLVPIQQGSCPGCGYVWPKKDKELATAEFGEVDMEKLIKAGKLLPEHLRGRKDYENMTVEELALVQKAKGFKPGWLTHRLVARHPEYDDLKAALTQVATLRDFKPGWVRRQLTSIF